MSELVDAAALAFRFGLAFVFLTAAIPKLSAPRDFERAVRNYALLPRVVVWPVARWLPRIELLCAAALLLGVAVPVIATAAAVMLTTFASGVAVNLLRGRAIDCGCTGTVAPRQIGWSLVAGDLALAVMAIIVASVNTRVLAVVPYPSGEVSVLTSAEGAAILLLAAAVVLGQLVLSSWLRLHAQIKRVTR
jgi:uncharacterized membrane protein YphA (DoxX/SURF4 family)